MDARANAGVERERRGEERKIQEKQRKRRKTKGRARRVISDTGESEGIEEKY